MPSFQLMLSAMPQGGWLGLGLGGGLGVLYILASVMTHRWAAQREAARFLAIVLGGMVIRMIIALALVGGIAAFMPVHVPIFIGAFFVTFVVGLALEVVRLHRHGTASMPADTSSE